MTSRSRTNRGLAERDEAYCEAPLDRLLDACRDRSFPGEDSDARKNAHDNMKGWACIGPGSYKDFLMEYGRKWAIRAFGGDFASPEELDLRLSSLGYWGASRFSEAGAFGAIRHNHVMNNVNSVYVGSRESVPCEESGRSYYFYPENGIMPEKQVEKVKEIVESHAKNGKPYTLVTVSPYVLKAVETWSDLLEQSDNVEYFDPNRGKSDVKAIFKELAIPFAKLLHGGRWEPEA